MLFWFAASQKMIRADRASDYIHVAARGDDFLRMRNMGVGLAVGAFFLL